MENNSPVLLGKLTRREFRERMESGELRAVLLPVAATEQHLEHLAMEHDWRSTRWIVEQAAQRMAPSVLVAPAFAVGISEHHMSHPGTLTLRPGTFLGVLNDIIRSLIRAGFENILVVNGHGGNIAPLEGVWDQFLREFPVNLQWISYWDLLTEQDAGEVLSGGAEALPGHAQEFETAVALAAFPDNVDRDAMRDQPDRSPLEASAEKGSVLLERIVERLCGKVRAMIDGESVARRPPFFP